MNHLQYGKTRNTFQKSEPTLPRKHCDERCITNTATSEAGESRITYIMCAITSIDSHTKKNPKV